MHNERDREREKDREGIRPKHIRSKSVGGRGHAGTVGVQDSKRNAAGPVKEEEVEEGGEAEGHKLNYRSIKGDNKNLLHFDHHEIIVRHSLSLHTPMQSGKIAGKHLKGRWTGERSMKNDTLTREREGGRGR